MYVLFNQAARKVHVLTIHVNQFPTDRFIVLKVTEMAELFY